MMPATEIPTPTLVKMRSVSTNPSMPPSTNRKAAS